MWQSGQTSRSWQAITKGWQIVNFHHDIFIRVKVSIIRRGNRPRATSMLRVPGATTRRTTATFSFTSRRSQFCHPSLIGILAVEVDAAVADFATGMSMMMGWHDALYKWQAPFANKGSAVLKCRNF
jgi:hypothetical protein